MKLSGPEIERLRQTVTRAESDWRPAVQVAFRELMLARARTYLEAGLAGIPPYHDKGTPVALQPEFEALLERSGFLTARLPRLTEHLRRYPHGAAPDAESFLYWSKEQLAGRPIVSITHVSIVRPDGPGLPSALVAGKQIFASHYMTGSLGLTAIVGGEDGQPPYLAYLNRSDVDLLGGVFGGLVRRIMEGRLRSEAAAVIQGLSERLESGDPPPRQPSS